MRRLVRDAVLVAATATAIWFVRGDAETPQVTYGVPMQVLCANGSIENATASQDGMGNVDLFWTSTQGAPSSYNGAANMQCVLYPDLRTPTP